MNFLAGIRDALWRWGRPIVSLSLLAFLLSQIDLGGSLKAIAGARPDLLALLLLAFILDRLIATYRWYLLLHGKNPLVTFNGVLRLVLVTGFVGYFMPGGSGSISSGSMASRASPRIHCCRSLRCWSSTSLRWLP